MAADGSETFDYVIVGSGAAGSVLAHRLTEDGTTRVCVIEAGPRDWNPYIRIPAGFMKTFFNLRITFPFHSDAVAGAAGRRIHLPQGRVVGGSSSINGMLYSRGQRGDYDDWAARGNRGWGVTLTFCPTSSASRVISDPATTTFAAAAGRCP